MKSELNKVAKLVIAIAIPLLIGFAGSFFTVASVDSWYATLNKPSFSPPNWLFGPAWTVLYVLIGLSFYLVWQKGFGSDKRKALGVFSIQLFLNFLWSILFFSLKSPMLAFAEIILLWPAIIANIIVFYKISKQAGHLLIPYLLWVSFAAVLNFSVWMLN